MAPLKKTPPKKSKSRKVLTLGDKLKILELLEENQTVAAVARKFNINESTVRGIHDNKDKIRKSCSQVGAHVN